MKKTRKIKDQTETTFFLTFVGEYVQITTNIISKTEALSEESTVIEEGPLRLQAYLLDEDESWYYIGGSPDQVTDAIKKVAVKHIRIVPMRSEVDIIFDGMEPEGGVN